MGEKTYSVDEAARQQILRARQQGLELVWDRLEAQKPQCGFGLLGLCCRHCVMGPCRIDPFGNGPKKGVCGADAHTMVARHICRMIAAGSSAHSDHGRRPALLLKEVAEGRVSDYAVSDSEKLKAVAKRLGITAEDERQLAVKVSEVALNDFGKQDSSPIRFLRSYAPKKRFELWERLGVIPRSIDREVVDVMHRTTMGVDHDPVSLLLQGVRCALADGWGGSLIATELQDVLFGTPKPRKVVANLGVLKADWVNIAVHGHEPVLSEVLARVALSERTQEMAREVGAKGVNLVGVCCTGNEVLVRRGIPVAGNELHTELVVTTGALEAMVVDVQCIYPALVELSRCFHTLFITTSEQARFPGAVHIPFEEARAEEVAHEIIRRAIENYPKRDGARVHIPEVSEEGVVGFSVEALLSALGGTLKPLIDAVSSGKIKGFAGLVGCNNPKVTQDRFHIELTKELVSRGIMVVGTGCWGIAALKHGLCKPEAAELCAEGLAEVCRSLGIPPALHMGACVDCSRILVLLSALADELGVDTSDLPVVGSAPEWTTEKAVAIGVYFVASGVPVHLWPEPPILGSSAVTELLTGGLKDVLGAWFFVEGDPKKAADRMEDIILERRKRLGL